jgi:hypothetical protein
LTPAWFSSVLGVEVRAATVVDQHSGTTGRARVALGTDEGSGVPPTLFVKLAPFDARQRQFVDAVGIGLSEARFYGTLGREVPVRLPRVWFAAIDEGGRYVMVLEDLSASGCTFLRPGDTDVADRARSTVVELGALHGAYWESDRFGGDLAWVPERAGFGRSDGKDAASVHAAGAFVRRALDRFGDDGGRVFRRVGELYADHTGDVLDWWDEGERTFIHGDPHMGNLFGDGPRTGFYDWAMCSRSPGVRDVAYFCCGSVPAPVRRELEDELLSSYCDALASAGVTLARSAAFEQYRLFSVFSWVSAVSTASVGSRWQPAQAAMDAMARATTALEDLDAAGFLGERLGG